MGNISIGRAYHILRICNHGDTDNMNLCNGRDPHNMNICNHRVTYNIFYISYEILD